jgi:hypothetical protein
MLHYYLAVSDQTVGRPRSFSLDSLLFLVFQVIHEVTIMMISILLVLASVCWAQYPTATASSNGATYTNPILNKMGADP